MSKRQFKVEIIFESNGEIDPQRIKNHLIRKSQLIFEVENNIGKDIRLQPFDYENTAKVTRLE